MKITRFLACFALLCIFAFGSPAPAQTVALAPVARQQFFSATGVPLAGGFLWTYAAGTTTLQATYTDSTGMIANANPIVLDSTGSANIWLSANAYKLVLYNAQSVQQWSVDNVSNLALMLQNGTITFTGTKTFSGTTNFTGTTNFSGTQNFSGTNNFSGAQNFSTLTAATTNSVNVVGTGITQWTGADLGAQINSAYAALPSGGGTIQVIAGSYTVSTPISFGTANKPVALVCPAGTTLTWSTTTGTMITVNNGSGTSGVSSPASSISDCILAGQGTSGTATGLFLGGTNGAAGFRFERGAIQSFALGLTYGGYTWRTMFTNTVLQADGQLFQWPSSVSTSGEEIGFVGVVFQNAGTYDNAVQLGSAGFEGNFVNCSFDNAQFAFTGGGVASITGAHFEDPGVNEADPYINLTNGNLSAVSVNMAQDSGSPAMTNMISVSGSSTLSMVGLNAVSAGAVTNLITQASTSQVYFFAPRTLNPFTNKLSYTGTGASFFDFGGGQIKVQGGGSLVEPSLTTGLLATSTPCYANGTPAVCTAAMAGSVALPASATALVVNTTAVTATSQIQLTFDSSKGSRLSVTCNTTPVQPTVSAISAATSFTITVPSAPTTNPACFDYTIIN